MKLKESGDSKYLPVTSISSGNLEQQVSTGVHLYTNQIVNVVFIESPSGWVLVDTGMPKCGGEILSTAEKLFGKGARPKAVILTHGHFDHVGGIVHLLEQWAVPVYAHPLEFPFLTGKQSYPEPDTSVEGGLLAKLSSLYPIEPVDISPALEPLPEGGAVPGLPEWRWLHVPGHSPGQIALFRAGDRTLVPGDAVITVRQDSLYRVLFQKREVCGPPVYLTTDWTAAETSVRTLQELQPQVLVPGHGHAMQGEELTRGLQRLVDSFAEVAVPDHGRFV
ncbi:MAG: beta-lactamase-like protein [Verrucomicrobiales bacterium]|nr:beta-lactamase-like protein [Verrucomicrobiales bacterium]